MTSEARRFWLDSVIQDIGNRIVDLAESGEIGYFDAYHPQNDTWRSRQVDEGWVWLQHTSDYGGSGAGSEDQFSVTVWQNADGTFDRNRGILAVSVIDRDRGSDGFNSWSKLGVRGDFSISALGQEPSDIDRYSSVWCGRD